MLNKLVMLSSLGLITLMGSGNAAGLQSTAHMTPDSTEAHFDSLVHTMLVGSSIAYGLDTTVSACEDHYQFVNGGWRDQIVIPESKEAGRQSINFFQYSFKKMLGRLEEMLDSSRVIASTTDDATVRVMGTFYESCMSADSLERSYIQQKYPRSASGRDSTRKEQCLNRTLEHLGGAAGQAFAEDLKRSGAITRMQTLLEALRESVQDRLKNNQIMSDAEKEYALERLGRLILRVGIPDQMVDYSVLQLSPTDYNQNKNLIGSFSNSRWAGSLGENVREKWKASLLMPNAFYMPYDHAIEIPTLMFSPPFFFEDGEDLLNFAGVGYVIGHEIFHSIAPQLSLVQDSAMAREIEAFKKFNSSLGTLDGWKVDGNRTFNEDVADLGGSRIAYHAWRETVAKDKTYKDQVIEGFTPDQRFFIAMGRIWRSKWTKKGIVYGSHAPGFARVNGIARQNPEFQKAFKCKKGDKMYIPQEKMSKIW